MAGPRTAPRCTAAERRRAAAVMRAAALRQRTAVRAPSFEEGGEGGGEAVKIYSTVSLSLLSLSLTHTHTWKKTTKLKKCLQPLCGKRVCVCMCVRAECQNPVSRDCNFFSSQASSRELSQEEEEEQEEDGAQRKEAGCDAQNSNTHTHTVQESTKRIFWSVHGKKNAVCEQGVALTEKSAHGI